MWLDHILLIFLSEEGHSGAFPFGPCEQGHCEHLCVDEMNRLGCSLGSGVAQSHGDSPAPGEALGRSSLLILREVESAEIEPLGEAEAGQLQARLLS